MSYENRKREYERLVAEDKHDLIPKNLLDEFGEMKKVYAEKVTKKKSKVKKNGK